MMMLLLAGALTFTPLYGTCGSDVHPATIHAIVEVESGGNPYAIHDGPTGTAIFPKSKKEAVEVAKRLLAKGHRLDVGLMQINTTHLKELRSRGIDVDDLFDPCTSIKAGTRILSEFYQLHAQKSPHDSSDLTLLKSLSSYNSGGAFKGKEYVRRILKKAHKAGNNWSTKIACNNRYQVYYPFRSNIRDTNTVASYRNITFFKKEEKSERTAATSNKSK